MTETLHRFIKRAKLPVRFQQASLADLTIDEGVKTLCQKFADDYIADDHGGQGLILYGPPGRGKSTIACAVMNEILTRAHRHQLGGCFEHTNPTKPGYYISFAGLAQAHYSAFSHDDDSELSRDLLSSLYYRSFRDWENTRVLVLDDVGKEHVGASGFTSDTLHDLLRTRYDNAAPTIVTSNIAPEDWESRYGEAMGSFIKEAFIWVKVKGADRR